MMWERAAGSRYMMGGDIAWPMIACSLTSPLWFNPEG